MWFGLIQTLPQGITVPLRVFLRENQASIPSSKASLTFAPFYSMTAYSARGKKEEKKRKLEERKKKLASLLEQERDAYEVHEIVGNNSFIMLIVLPVARIK